MTTDLSNSDLLMELFESSVSSSAGAANAKAVRKDRYRDLVAYQNVTSFSMQSTLATCPRKLQLDKLGASIVNDGEEETNVDFAFGHSVGAGVATFDETGDVRQALWAAFLAWNTDLLEEGPPPKPNRPARNKTFWYALWAIQVYQTFREEETDLADYNVVKNEATIAIDFEDGHFYVGHIDTLLQHKHTGKYKVKENKTTVFASVDPALWANSNQALSYAIVLDGFGASEYDVLYTIYSSTEQRWLSLEFTKHSILKAEWLQGQFFIHDQLESYTEKNVFPKNGQSCYQFGRRCKYYENCDWDTVRRYGKTFGDLPWLDSLDELEKIEHLDYRFSFSELVKQQQAKLQLPTSTPNQGYDCEEI